MVLEIGYRVFQSTSKGGPADDDSADRLSYRITTMILFASAILIGSKQIVGDPITCWIPAHFTGNHEAYTNSYCWIRNTYYLPWDENIPREHEPEKRQMITYYQWISLILMIQAMFFYLPRFFWTVFKNRVGVDITYLMSEAVKVQNCMQYENHEKTLNNMAEHMHRMLRRPTSRVSRVTASAKSVMSRTCCRCAGRNKGNYLIAVFIIHKILYLANILGQMFVLNYILGFNFNMYGIEVIQSLANNQEWVKTPFPRVTMCDMNIRRLGNVHRYAVQCVLPINLFTEKLYLLQWFWYVLLLTLSCIEFIQWIMRIVVWRKNRVNYIRKHLELAKKNFDDDNQLNIDDLEAFTDSYLKQDGVFILRLIAKNSTQGIATMFTKAIWTKYKEWKAEAEKSTGSDPSTPGQDTKPSHKADPDIKTPLLAPGTKPSAPDMPHVGFDDSTLPSKARNY